MENKENTQPKFSPGPWFASGQLIFAESKKRPIYIAAVNGLWLLTGNTFEANAALIAAAPEMYEMLDMLASCGCIPNGIYTAAIRKLLAKARGEEKR